MGDAVPTAIAANSNPKGVNLRSNTASWRSMEIAELSGDKRSGGFDVLWLRGVFHMRKKLRRSESGVIAADF